MRRLSKELGVSPMAPYYYVADKNGLLDLVVEAVLSEVVVPGPADGAWDVRLRLLIDRIDAELRSHPGLGDVLLEGLLGAQRGLLDAIMELLLEAGFGERDVLMAYATVHTYLYGRHKVAMATPDRAPGVEQPPSIARTAAHLDSVSGRDYYSFGVETIIAGLRAQLRCGQASERAQVVRCAGIRPRAPNSSVKVPPQHPVADLRADARRRGRAGSPGCARRCPRGAGSHRPTARCGSRSARMTCTALMSCWNDA